MQFEVFTLFPEVFDPYLNSSILERARQRGFVEVNLHNFRDWALDRHKMTDDVPYGGGGGMIMKPEPIFQAVEGVLGAPPSCPVILLTPQGRPFSQKIARELATHKRLALISGRYEGVDERVRLHLVDEELSIGDYILTGGELAAMVLIDALTRLIPGVLGDPTRRTKIHSQPVGLNILTIPVLRTSGGGRFRRFYDRGIMVGSGAGAASKRFCAPGFAGRTCWQGWI